MTAGVVQTAHANQWGRRSGETVDSRLILDQVRCGSTGQHLRPAPDKLCAALCSCTNPAVAFLDVNEILGFHKPYAAEYFSECVFLSGTFSQFIAVRTLAFAREAHCESLIVVGQIS